MRSLFSGEKTSGVFGETGVAGEPSLCAVLSRHVARGDARGLVAHLAAGDAAGGCTVRPAPVVGPRHG